ncbi:MAG TPA: hypothetical protein VGF20_11895 [Candidatus Acidoferrum sp.]
MSQSNAMNAANSGTAPPSPWRDSFLEAVRFWEPRRLIYNLLLLAVTVTWILATWPHFRPAMNLTAALQVSVLGLIANVLYSAAYLVEFALQGISANKVRQSLRWTVWVIGTILAFVLTNYWIADEIFPDVH